MSRGHGDRRDRTTVQSEAGMNRKKTRILRWRGVLADSPRMLRIMVAIVLAVAGAALTFTQLGFVAIEMPSGSTGYVVVLLQVVALGALLLGTLPGTALGIVAGGVLFLHARVLPLDPYELSFITPLTSVIMFGVTGFLLGIMFAIALRNDPSRFKRVLYIVIVCVIVSVLYGVGFIVNVTISLGAEISATMGPGVSVDVVQDLAFATFHQLGDMSVQIWGTGLLMVALCIVGDLLARKVRVSRGTLGLRTVFGAWLGVTVALAFMVMSAVSFAVTTVDEVWDAQLNMESDASYILEQLDETGERSKMFDAFAAKTGFDTDALDDEDLENLMGAISSNDLLSGYAVADHGTMAVLYDGVVFMANDAGVELGITEDEAFGEDEREAIEKSIQEGYVQRVIRGVSARDYKNASEGGEVSRAPKPYIAYVYAKRSTIDYGEGYNFDFTVAVMQPSDKVFEKRPSIMMWMVISEFALLLVVFAIVFALVNRVVIRHIDEENAALAHRRPGHPHGQALHRRDALRARRFLQRGDHREEVVTRRPCQNS